MKTAKDHAAQLSTMAHVIRNLDDMIVYAAIGNEDVPESAREELYGIMDDIDDIADRLDRASEKAAGRWDE